MARPGRKWALIADANPDGVGGAYASAFRRRGINVVATATDTEGMEYLEPESGTDEGFLVTLQLDASCPGSIAAAVTQVRQLTDGHLDFLLNMSNSAYYVPLIDGDIEQAKKQFDLGVWGPLAVTKAFFPMLQASKGVVVNQVKPTGLTGLTKPFAGIGSSVQAAILNMSSVLRVELEPFGIKVVTLIADDLQAGRIDGLTGEGVSQSSPYFPIKDDADRVMASYSANKSRDMYEIANETLDQLLGEAPPSYIRKGFMAYLLPLFYWLIPTSILDSFATRSGSLDRLKRILSGAADDKKDE